MQSNKIPIPPAAVRPVGRAGMGRQGWWWRSFAWRAPIWLLLIWSSVAGLAAAEEVVIVRSSDAGPYQAAAEKVRARMAAEGHGVEVQDLTDLSDNDAAGLQAIVKAAKTRLFVAIGTQAAAWLHKQAPAAIGVVYCMVSDPATAGLDKGRFSRGVSTTVATADQLQLILEALPKARKIGMLYSTADKTSAAGMEALKGRLKEGYQLVAIAIEDSENTTVAVQQLIDAKPDIVWTSPDANVFNAATVRVLLLGALRAKVAVFGFSAGFVRAGALFGLGVEPAMQGEQCAQLAVDYLEAVKHDRLAQFELLPRVVSPKFQLAVNKIVDKQLDSPLAEAVVAKAEVVFQ